AGHVDQHVLRHAVVVVGIVGRVLVVPLDLAGIGVERQRAVGIEVVAGPIFIIPVRAGVADAPDESVGCRIVASRHPCRTAAARGSVLVVLPGFAAGLALAGDRVGAPDFLLGLEIGRRDPATDAVFRAGYARDGHVLDDQRCAGDDLALVRIGHLSLPGDLAGILVGRDQAAIERVRDDEIAPQRHTAIVDAAASHGARPVVVGLWIHLPEQHALTAMRVDLVDRAPPVGDVHHAVLDDRRAFGTAMRPDA